LDVFAQTRALGTTMRFVTHPLFALGLCVFPPALGSSVRPAPIEVGVHATTPSPRRLDDSERAVLAAASARATHLSTQRAGDIDFHLSGRDLRVIAIAVVVTILIIVIV
jgi:hypothetical protein